MPWTDAAVTGSSVPSGDAESLRYSVKFDHAATPVGDLIQCAVHAERVGLRGYGMMLAEVGLPPGTEVDRASLDSAVSASGWDLQSYEVQPDRVVFYLWPRAGGTTFSFAFRPRFAMTAQSSESILYDYYNPESTSFGATHALHREMNLTGLASPLSGVLFVADFYADMLDIQRA